MKLSRKTLRVDVVVVGAGVAGLSTAYHLASHSKLRVLVLEQEKILGGHASGRNAGMVRQAIADPMIARLAVEGRRALARASRSGWKKINFLSNGSLLLADTPNLPEIKKIRKAMERLGITTHWLSRIEVAAKVPILQNSRFKKALFCPSDALLEIRSLLDLFYGQLKKKGVPVFFGVMPLGIVPSEHGFRMDLAGQTIFTKKIVNAAGAWCALLAEKIGGQAIPLKPYRRHLYVTEPLRMRHEMWPFVWDLSREFYFRPEGKGLLLSPCDKAPMGKKFLSQRKEKVDAGMKKHLLQKMKYYSKEMAALKIETQKSGLRTMTSDGRFVIGEDARLPGFYWVAGLGGHGVTTCFSVGKLSSDIILGKRADPELVKAFSPHRFFRDCP